jgi:DNA integrity scanning protein DisA with diadenylate cyclase activity
VLLALSRKLIGADDVVVCLVGRPNVSALDTILVVQVGSEFDTFLNQDDDGQDLSADVLPEVLERVLNVAAELGSEGREGKPVGAIFVLGDSERVISLSKQLILNPFHGYPDDRRNVLDPDLKETVKELASIDGAFVIRRDGVIESCGTYLKTASQTEFELPPGLGARHQAAAAITSLTDSVAITVSESTGNVTVFRRGRIVAEIEKPRMPSRRKRDTDGDG